MPEETEEMFFYYGIAVGLAVSALVIVFGLIIFVWWALR
jgi:hypothetical protein